MEWQNKAIANLIRRIGRIENMDIKEMGKYSQNGLIETAKDHFETIMLPKLTAISEKAVSHILVFVEGSVKKRVKKQVEKIEIPLPSSFGCTYKKMTAMKQALRNTENDDLLRRIRK